MLKNQISELYKKYERWVPIASFVLGFIFDIIMLHRIDEPMVIFQQALYLIIAAVLIGVEVIEQVRAVPPPFLFAKIWKYREAFLHFLLGTLLNSYAIFYFKSASAFTSLIFIGLLVLVLTINEFKRFGKSQTQVHVAFLSLCLISYLISLAPMILGFIGTIPFLSAVALSVTLFWGYYKILKQKLDNTPHLHRTHLVYPFAAVHVLFVALYFAHLIPPVPLSVKYMGIFHSAEKSPEGYTLTYTRSPWKFWQHGDQTFEARPGDVIHCYVQIFSPARFKDRLNVRWLYDDEKLGWVSTDAIALSVVGGRDEGYRAIMKKANFQPGRMRAQVETADGQEIGRITFEVVADETMGERELRTIVKN